MTDLTAYRACLKEASVQARDLILHCIHTAEASMPGRIHRAPDLAERQRIHEAITALKQHEAALAMAYPQELLAEFTRQAAGTERAAAAGLSFAELELVDDEQVQERVEVVRVQQAVIGAVEAELVPLNALVCAAQGLATVQADRNPLGPQAYVRALRTVVQASAVPGPVRLRWLQYLGEALGPELARTYVGLVAFLRRQGVSEAGFKVIAQPGTGAGAAGAAARRQPETSPLLTVTALRRLLAGDPASATSAPAALPRPEGDGFSETMPAAAELLEEIRDPAAVLRRLRERELREGSAGPAAMREALRSQVQRPGQAVALEVVSLLVENVAGDPRLLPPVQAAVRALEPALLRLALADPRFFSDRRHPARRLLDEMTSRSLAWTSDEEPGFDAFMEPLREAVHVLAETHVTGAEPYRFALETLKEAWERGASRDRRRREKAVRSLLHAEQRNLLAKRLAQEVSAREDMERVPPEVRAFLCGPWVQVIAEAQLSDREGSGDPGGYRALVPELLWSVQPHTTPVAVARLQRQLPGLLETLRRGLQSVGYPEDRIARFFDRLAQIHQQAIKGQAVSPAATSANLSLLLDLQEGEGAWLAPREAQDTGFLEPASGLGRPVFAETAPATGRSSATPDETAPAPLELEAGQWVELLLDGSWSRWQVGWTSPHRQLLLFTGAGGRTRSMTPALAAMMARNGMLRVVSAAPVLEQAFDAVADAALRNTAEEPSEWSWSRNGAL